MADFDPFPDDTFITSFPKSGNTWVRFFTANLLARHLDVNLTNLDSIVPDIYKVSNTVLEAVPRPRYLKSHSQYNGKYARVVYLVRDVRDVVCSHYRQKIRMGQFPRGTPISEFTEEFIAGRTSMFGHWDKHVVGWIFRQHEGNRKFTFFRYEDLHSNGLREFLSLARALDIRRSSKAVAEAYQNSAFERMRQLEREAKLNWLEKKGAKDTSIPFMYSGQPERWRTDLDKKSKTLLTLEYGSLLEQLGYRI